MRTCNQASQQPLSPFVLARRGITPGFSQTGRDCLAAHSRPYWSYGDCVRAFARNTARLPPSSTQATLPHYGFSRGTTASDTELTLAYEKSLMSFASSVEALRVYFHLARALNMTAVLPKWPKSDAWAPAFARH